MSSNIVINDPYAPGGLRVWDDYQFRRKGIRRAGGGPPLPVIPPVITTPPVNVVLPVVDGGLTQGQDLFCTEGTWTGTLPIAYDYQWYRVALAPVATPPVNSVVPLIFGVAVEGQDLTCPTGTWSGTAPITYDYQWYRTETPAVPTAPSSTTAPFISGSLIVGNALHSTTGSWAGAAPIAYSYQWKRLPSTLIGSNSPNYTTVTVDIGETITCTVTAINSVGSASQLASNSKGPISEVPTAEILTVDGVALTVDGEELTT